MAKNAFGYEPHSSRVGLWLDSDKGRVDLGQVCSEFIIASEPVELPPGTVGELFISVDDNISQQSVILKEGMAPTRTRTSIELYQEPPF